MELKTPCRLLNVKTKVRQLIDYVDNDAAFKAEDNQNKNMSWRTTTVTELDGNGYEEDRLVGKEIIATYAVLDKNGTDYIAEDNSNIILSIDDQNNKDSETLQNNDFEIKLLPYEEADRQAKITATNGDGSLDEEKYKEELDKLYTSEIELQVSKVVSAEDQADNLAFDNVAEIVKFENSAGRRMTIAVPGNVEPKRGEFIQEVGNGDKKDSYILEIDSSATELVTFIPPTGIEEVKSYKTQIAIAVTLGMLILVGGIVVIKKKVLK